MKYRVESDEDFKENMAELNDVLTSPNSVSNVIKKFSTASKETERLIDELITKIEARSSDRQKLNGNKSTR